MADTEKHRYIFVNGCDGSPLSLPDNDIWFYDTDVDDLTEEEAKAHACELSLRLGGYLVSAKRVKELICVQYFEGRFVDRMCEPIPASEIPEAFRGLLAD